ncbi:MAG: DNA cytosine methyltransferase [Desulfarculus sp.]|nr:DNA cytosine methyltransferase [Desulfarculus sp.]
MTSRPTAIDLFCGAGGLSEGLCQAGFEILAANDFDKFAESTFRQQHPKTKFFSGPIERISVKDIFVSLGLRKGELDCLAGGPPCQAFSVYNHQRGLHDYRSSLFREYLRIVEGLRPKWLIMENVPGMRDIGNGQTINEIIYQLSRLGYAVQTRILKSEEFGVPQERRRLFFIGTNTDGTFFWPNPTHGYGKLDFVNVWNAISDLPVLINGQSGTGRPYPSKPQNAFQRELRRGQKIVNNHDAPRLAHINLERMKYIPMGGNWTNIPEYLLPEGMKRARRCDHTKRYGRLDPNGLSSTVLTKCDLHWGAFIHPFQDRVLTVREAARIQSFPDNFEFKGPRTEQYIQVGNAVPVMLARCLGNSILAALTTHSYQNVACAS